MTALQRGRHGESSSDSGVTDKAGLLAVAASIEQMIGRGNLLPGQRLVEGDLASELSISRGSIREALRYLAGEGLVELLPKRGARVMKLDRVRLGHMFEFYGLFSWVGMTFFAARPISAQVRAELQAASSYISLAGTTQSMPLMVEAMHRYHAVLANNCGNPIFKEMFQKLHLEVFIRQSLPIEDLSEIQSVCEMYPYITEMLLRGDAESAFKALKPGLALVGKRFRVDALDAEVSLDAATT